VITATYPIRAKRHATWSDQLLLEQEIPPVAPVTVTTWEPIDLTGYTARMMVRTRDDVEDGATLLATLDTSTTGLTLGGVAGTITMELPGTLTGMIPAGRWVYDLRLVPPSGDADYLVEGPFIMAPTVTTP
jgi:hypothetical protein